MACGGGAKLILTSQIYEKAIKSWKTERPLEKYRETMECFEKTSVQYSLVTFQCCSKAKMGSWVK